MKRLLVCVLILNALLVGDRILLTFAGTPSPSRCANEIGDVDASGLIDINDGIVLLSSVILGDPPELLPLCEDPDLAICQDDLAATQAELAASRDDLVDTQGTLSICQADLAASQGTLATCQAELDTSQDALSICQADLAASQDALASCQEALLACEAPPATREIEGFTFVEINEQGIPEYTHDQTGIEFVLLPGGTFDLGSSNSSCHEEGPAGPLQEQRGRSGGLGLVKLESDSTTHASLCLATARGTDKPTPV